MGEVSRAATVSYLLDTNVCIHVLNDNQRIVSRLRVLSPNAVRLCSVVVSELVYGAHNSARVDENLNRLRRFCTFFLSLPFDDAAGYECGRIRAVLRKAGAPVSPNDAMIAAIARANDLTLVTHNISEFSRVEGLRLEDWEC